MNLLMDVNDKFRIAKHTPPLIHTFNSLNSGELMITVLLEQMLLMLSGVLIGC